LIKPDSSTRGREKLFEALEQKVPTGGRVLLSYGEIDCRAHLLKHAEETKRPIAEVVDECVERYFRVIEEVRGRGYELIVYNAPPSGRRPNKSHFPSHGTCLERNAVTRLYNTALASRCVEARIKFLGTFDDLVPTSGWSREYYFWDHIHVGQRAMPVTLRKLGQLFPKEDFTPSAAWQRAVFWSRLLPRKRVRFDEVGT
jgi:hypothetical protein